MSKTRENAIKGRRPIMYVPSCWRNWTQCPGGDSRFRPRLLSATRELGLTSWTGDGRDVGPADPQMAVRPVAGNAGQAAERGAGLEVVDEAGPRLSRWQVRLLEERHELHKARPAAPLGRERNKDVESDSAFFGHVAYRLFGGFLERSPQSDNVSSVALADSDSLSSSTPAPTVRPYLSTLLLPGLQVARCAS
jgi:hypothetical protein